MRLEMDNGSGFVTQKVSSCSIEAGESCNATYTKTFSAAGTYRFRVACVQVNSGPDAVQQSKDYVTLEVTNETCTSGAKRLCKLQAGVCSGTTQSCVNGFWGSCGGFSGAYEPAERTTADGLDNDCDGMVDEQENQLLISNMEGDGSLNVFEYNAAKKRFDSIWGGRDNPNTLIVGGGQLGDVNHDGRKDIVLVQKDPKNSLDAYLAIWSRDLSQDAWRRIYRTYLFGTIHHVGPIGDFDKDGKNEFILASNGSNAFEVWGTKALGSETFAKLATLHTCVNGNAYYIKPAGDFDGDGTLEIVTHCAGVPPDTPQDVVVYKWKDTGYSQVASVPSPIATIDHSGIGDIDGDGKAEAVVCGNSKSSHVLGYKDGRYQFVYTAPLGLELTQSCAVGDFDGDGRSEWVDFAGGQVRVFGYRNGYRQLWQGVGGEKAPPLGSAAAGDIDHDGNDEFVILSTANYRHPQAMLWKYVPGSSDSLSFENIYNFPSANGTVIIGQFLTDADTPEISRGGVVNAAKSVAGEPMSPGGVVSIYGRNLALSSQAATEVPLPRTLAGARVVIGDKEAPLFYASIGQINAQVPIELAAGATYPVVVKRGSQSSTPETIRVVELDPGIVTDTTGRVIAQHADYSLITSSSPAKPDEWIILYLVGMGATSPTVATGTASPQSPLAMVATQPVVTIGGATAELYFGGLTPGAVGLYQIVCKIPSSATAGELPLVVTQGGATANRATLPVTR
ncbi:MAG: FG-GAP-like repeat-containing protein [Bryobacteraceae bacterium]